jgi:serine/threonine protein kinase
MRIAQLGKYKIVDKLGQGAMGEVFRAHDPVLGRDVAVKITAGKLGGDEAARQRFLREARAAAQLNHPNIVTVYDFGEEQGVAYMAMELLEGTDLRALIEKGRIKDLEDKLAVMEQILDGLAFAHAKGLVHRDLKPANIHVLPNGQVKVMDFGLARREEDAAATGAVMGTPYYMAPETAQGQASTTRTDVFSLGAVFYELLSGKRPFTGPSIPAVLLAVATKDPEPLAQAAPQLPAALGPFVSRALAKNPDGRYADAAEMLEALRIVWSGGELPEASVHPTFATLDESPARTLGPSLSSRPDTPDELRTALDEIDQYLADRVPPLMACDAVSQLTKVPLEGAAAELWAWAEKQQLMEVLHPIVDLLFHALHKLSMVGELGLVEKNGLIAYLRGVGLELATALPPGDRDRLRRALRHLGESEMVRTGPVELRKMVEPPASTTLSATPGLKRLSLLEQRLRRGVGTTPAAQVAHRRVVSQAITLAANEARSERELEDHLRRLRSVGVASGAEHVFRSLGGELADWALPKMASDTADLGPAHEVQAMKQIVSLPEDPVEVARRYHHLVTAAVEQFNAGNLGGAVQMFELATKLAAEKKIEKGYTEPVLARGHEALDAGRMRQYLERPDRHPQLQTVMAFFESGLGPGTLLDEMENEERRDRRRLLLDLLAIHGDRARSVALTRLLSSLAKPASDFARRNWIYLLRVMPRPAGEAPEAEIDAVSRFATPGNPAYLAKEALLHLSHTRHPHAAHALVTLLRAWEEQLETEALPPPEREEALGTLDRIASGLARQGGRKAWGELVDHALSRQPKLGATLDRLSELGLQDLSSAPDVVSRLSDAVQDALPRGVFSRLVARRDHELPALIGALAGTRTPAVRALLEDVARRFASHEAGRAATRAMEAPAPPAPAGISGELDPYALPNLLHRVAEARSTGTLNLLPGEGAGLPATVGFVQGAIVAARWAQRQGLDAVYQLFERPFAGRYAFDPVTKPARAGSLGELQAILREGVRRARELRRASAIVPDDVPLEATGAAPGTVQEETEYDLVVTLWQRSCSGVSVERLETELAADVFRILRPLAQWIEEGALRPVLPPEPAAAPAASASAPGT